MKNWHDDYCNNDKIIDYDKERNLTNYEKDDSDKMMENKWKNEDEIKGNITCKKFDFFC